DPQRCSLAGRSWIDSSSAFETRNGILGATTMKRWASLSLSAAAAAVAFGWVLAADRKDPDPTRFSEHLIADKYGYAYGVAAADLDGDGDIDLVSGDTTNNVLYWFENDGKGNFTRHIIQKDEPGWFERIAIGDLDGDGRPDVVVVKNLHGHIVWFRNK